MSPPMTVRDAPIAVDIDLKGVRALILTVEFGERGDVQDLADWVEAPNHPPGAMIAGFADFGTSPARSCSCSRSFFPCRVGVSNMSNDDEANTTPERFTSLAHLASAVGHSVINSYSAIVSNAEILRLTAKAGLPVDPIAIADMIVRTAVDASGVARRLIDYTRPVTTIGSKTVALDRLIEEIAAEYQDDDSSPVVYLAKSKPVPLIRGHAPQIRAMIGHLVRNAEEALGGAGGTITLAAELDDRGWISVEVRDTGPGMAPGVQERAVEPFFTTKNGHLGVGLSIANGIWRRHRGTMAIRTQQDDGTTVRLCVDPIEGGFHVP